MRKREARIREKRPFVVAEFVLSFNYHGRAWTVGCKTEESARASFERRVAKNLAETGEPGAVIAYQRFKRRPIAWTEKITDPKQTLRYWDPDFS